MSKTVLVVDYHAPSREGLQRWFRDAGWQVEATASARAAIDKVREGGLALAIVDLDLPPAHGLVADGWDLVRTIRALDPAVAIVGIGALREPDWTARAQRLSLTEVLEKPVSPSRLLPIGVGALGRAAGTTHGRVAQ